MTKYIIRWNVGYGDSWNLIEADTVDEAEGMAEDEARQDAECNMDYEALEFTLDNAENYGYEEEHPDYVEED